MLKTGALGSDGCGYPGAPAHSSVRFSGPGIDDVIDEEDGPIGNALGNGLFAHNTVATYSCERGFELLGPARRHCNKDSNGTWTPEGVPFCGKCCAFVIILISPHWSLYLGGVK